MAEPRIPKGWSSPGISRRLGSWWWDDGEWWPCDNTQFKEPEPSFRIRKVNRLDHTTTDDPNHALALEDAYDAGRLSMADDVRREIGKTICDRQMMITMADLEERIKALPGALPK